MEDGGGTLDASFTGIMNLGQAASHSVTDVSFADVPVGSDGTYGYGTPGDRIRGCRMWSGIWPGMAPHGPANRKWPRHGSEP